MTVTKDQGKAMLLVAILLVLFTWWHSDDKTPTPPRVYPPDTSVPISHRLPSKAESDKALKILREQEISQTRLRDHLMTYAASGQNRQGILEIRMGEQELDEAMDALRELKDWNAVDGGEGIGMLREMRDHLRSSIWQFEALERKFGKVE